MFFPGQTLNFLGNSERADFCEAADMSGHCSLGKRGGIMAAMQHDRNLLKAGQAAGRKSLRFTLADIGAVIQPTRESIQTMIYRPRRWWSGKLIVARSCAPLLPEL